jgi:hypothetical protein
MSLITLMGAQQELIRVVDSKGVAYTTTPISNSLFR